MDHTEWIALSIVAVAVIVYVRGLFKKSKGGDCCSEACSLKSKSKPSKKTDV